MLRSFGSFTRALLHMGADRDIYGRPTVSRNDGSWLGTCFTKGSRRLTLAGRTTMPKVNCLAPPRTYIVGQLLSFDASKWAARQCPSLKPICSRPKQSARRWPNSANSAHAPTAPAKVDSSARWSAWLITTTSSNSFFSAPMGAA